MIFSIRATAYFSLGLVATTRPGADCLFRLGWVCTRHDRHEKWPIIEDENWELERLDVDNGQSDSMHMSLESERVSGDHAYMSEYYYCDNDESEYLFPCDGSGNELISREKNRIIKLFTCFSGKENAE